MPGESERLTARLVGVIPGALAISLVLLTLAPMGLPYWNRVAPNFALMSVFYWTIFRPDLMPTWFAFLLGLLLDGVAGGPLGVYALTFTIVRGLSFNQRRVFVGKSFVIGWWGFIVVAVLATLFAWAVISLYHGHLYALRAVLVQLGLTVALYPAVAWLFGRAEIALLRR
jgi:rod shape-determining protein MreD